MTKKAPDYALESMRGLIGYLQAVDNLLSVSIRGIKCIPEIIDMLLETAGKDDPDREAENRFKSDAEFAAKECEAGFPLLHEFTLVGIWGAFEAAIEDLMVGILSNEPELLRADPFTKIRIPLADFETLDKEDRMRIVLRELQDNTIRSEQKRGVNRFESILSVVGLSGPVKDTTREDLWEMHHVRNVIVHRRSCADRTFVSACPKFGAKIGDRVIITHDLLGRYFQSVFNYTREIVYRIKARFGVDVSEKPQQLESSKDSRSAIETDEPT